MKKYLLLMAVMVLPLVFAGCGGDDEVEFADTDIILVPQATRVQKFGQYQILGAKLSYVEKGVTCLWAFSSANDKGWESDSIALVWWPQSIGKYTITATLSKNGAKKVLTKQCDVVECSGGLGFAYQPAEEIFANETMYSVYFYQTMPEVDASTEYIGSKMYIVWKFKNPGMGYYRKYYFGDDGLYTVVHVPY